MKNFIACALLMILATMSFHLSGFTTKQRIGLGTGVILLVFALRFLDRAMKVLLP